MADIAVPPSPIFSLVELVEAQNHHHQYKEDGSCSRGCCWIGARPGSDT